MKTQRAYIQDDILLPDNDMMEFMPGAQLPKDEFALIHEINDQFDSIFRSDI